MNLHDHALACDAYMHHLSGVYADRSVYDQSKVRAVQERDVLLCTIDSMDKSKFALPRFSMGIVPKGIENKQRPQCELTAVILHGRCLAVYVGDCDSTSGSDWSMEMLARTLEKGFSKAQAAGEAWPRCLRIFSDNTPKDIPWNEY